MFSADQIVAHLVGDYLFQSHWMATNKTSKSVAAFVHAVTYTIPFLFLSTNEWALFVICVSHFVIDRWRLARFVCWFKNYPWEPWEKCSTTGYPSDVPPWLSVWLLIISDNTIHIICNGLALHYFGG